MLVSAGRDGPYSRQYISFEQKGLSYQASKSDLLPNVCLRKQSRGMAGAPESKMQTMLLEFPKD